MSKLILKPAFATSRIPAGWKRSVSRETINGLAYANSMGIAIGNNGTLLRTADAQTWDCVTPLNNKGNNFLGIAWSGAYWVAVGAAGVVAYSSDGLKWTYTQLPASFTSYCTAYGAGVHVVFNPNRDTYNSTDLVTWTKGGLTPLVTTVYDVLWDGAKFVAVGGWAANSMSADGLISVDGKVWQNIVFPSAVAGTQLNAIAYSGTKYVVVGNSGYIATSTDGQGWTKCTSPVSTSNITDVVWAGDRFVAMSSARPIYSLDGTTWVTAGTSDPFNYLAYTGTSIIGVYGSNYLARSSDGGNTWSAHKTMPFRSSTIAPGLSSVSVSAVNGKLFIANTSGKLFLSEDQGVNWTTLNMPYTNTYQLYSGVRFVNGLYIISGSGGALLTSVDGRTWVQRSTGSTQPIYSVAASPSVYVFGDTTGYFYASADCISWSYMGNNVVTSPRCISWNGQQFVASGDENIVAVGTTGASWTKNIIKYNTLMYNCLHVWTGSRYALIAKNGLTFTSVDAVTWVQTSSSVTWTPVGIANNGNLVLAINGAGVATVARSTDGGQTWAAVPIPTGAILSSICWTGSKFIAVSSSSVVPLIMSSADGLNWVLETFPTTSVAFLRISEDRSTLIAGNSAGEYMESKDKGNTWTHNMSVANLKDALTVNGTTRILAGTSMYSTTDKVSWALTKTFTATPYSVDYNGLSRFIAGTGYGGAVSTYLYYSDDAGSTWTNINTNVSGVKKVRYLNGKWLVLTYTPSATNVIYTSADNGVTWGNNSATASATLYMDIAYGVNRYVVVGVGGKVWSSTDSLNWTLRSSGTTADLTAMMYGGGMFVAVGTLASVVSYDGETWSFINTYIASALVDVVWDGTSFIAISTNGSVAKLTPI